jgi:hypothetical protein
LTCRNWGVETGPRLEKGTPGHLGNVPPQLSRVRVVAGLPTLSLYPSLAVADSFSVGLLIVAVLPWLSELLVSAKLPGGWELVFREIKENQAKQSDLLLSQQEQILALRAAVRGIVTKYEHDKLVGLSKNAPFLCYYADDMFEELKHLRALNLISHHDGSGLAKMRSDHKGKNGKFDLKHYFYITDDGREYLRLRGETEPKNS